MKQSWINKKETYNIECKFFIQDRAFCCDLSSYEIQPTMGQFWINKKEYMAFRIKFS